ncbi:hypothetical protein EDD99_5431 [Streptomyces sp. 846.5]|nr:hypothetical protein [Streptomyces sp. 846.5]TDT97312.1 hypothetical protein EDD99_5431 [Streptomyces sp. 846.5]
MRLHPDDATQLSTAAWTQAPCAVHPHDGEQLVTETRPGEGNLYCREHAELLLTYHRAMPARANR